MNFRQDIQVLRGYAVLVILLFHAQIGPYSSGFLGVDIFFVISGFLITNLIVKKIEAGTFSFGEFYFRRAQRLLPAAFCILLFTTIGSYFFLGASDLFDYKNQLLGALTFTANFALLDQTDYFAGDAKLKPLLHMWSLAIEEQFYLLLPMTLVFAPKSLWKIGAWACVALSAAACFYLRGLYPDHTFYLLPTRAWELGIGCLGALYLNRADWARYYKVLFWPALALILYIPVFPLSQGHPGLDAAIVCIATLIIILRQSSALNDSLWMRPIAKIGDYSYSLYLVHWPLYAFAENLYNGTYIPLWVRGGLLAASFLLAIILYHTIENPIHRRRFTNKKAFIGGLLVAAIGLAGLSLAIHYMSNQQRDIYLEKLRTNYGFDESCSHKAKYQQLKSCQNSESPTMMVWGDSFAMHLVAGLESVYDKGIIQATKSVCAPYMHISNHRVAKSIDWGNECIEFNNDVLKTLESLISVEIVVLSASFRGIENEIFEGREWKDGKFHDITIDHARAYRAIKETVDAIRSMGKRVVLISPMPRTRVNMAHCLERQESGKIMAGIQSCNILLSESNRVNNNTNRFLQSMPENAGVSFINLEDYVCDDHRCITMLNDKFLYRDRTHLSYEGSIELFNTFDILKDIHEKAY